MAHNAHIPAGRTPVPDHSGPASARPHHRKASGIPLRPGLLLPGLLRPALLHSLRFLLPALISTAAHAQLSLSTAVDLALRNNPRIKVAQADVARAEALISQSHDVYIPSISAGAGLGYAYGYSPYPPTLFTFNGGSLIFNPAQKYYVRSARAGLDAAHHSYDEARDAVSEDTAQAYLSLQHNQQRLAVITEQNTFAASLVSILQARLDGGQASPIDLTQARLTGANLRLALLHVQDDVAADRDHLARLLGVPADSLSIDNSFPSTPGMDPQTRPEAEFASPAVSSAYANALARQEQAAGDARFRFRPQINLVVQYNRYATFTQSFHTLRDQYLNSSNGKSNLTANEYVVGVQVNLPLYDRYRQAKARESAADASHALHEAENAKLTALDAQARLRHSLPEIEARADVAALQQQLAQQQLEVMRVQLQAGNPSGPQMTPADEQNARIAERDKYLNVLDADFQLHTTQLQLLRMTGRLNTWLRNALIQPAAPAPSAPAPSAPSTPSAPPVPNAQSLPSAPSPTPR